MGRIYLVRHAQTEWNNQRRWQGICDIELNDFGREQVAAVRELFTGISVSRVYVSDLSRAKETAQAVVDATGAPIEVRSSLRERSFGEWEGHTSAELNEQHPEQMAAYRADRDAYSPPGGQSWNIFAEKAVAAFGDVAREHPHEAIAIVSHGGPIKAFINSVLGITRGRLNRFRIDNASVSIVEQVNHDVASTIAWQLVALNITHHLNGKLGS